MDFCFQSGDTLWCLDLVTLLTLSLALLELEEETGAISCEEAAGRLVAAAHGAGRAGDDQIPPVQPLVHLSTTVKHTVK